MRSSRKHDQNLDIILELANDPKKISYVVTHKQKLEIIKQNFQLNRKYPGSDEKQCKNCGQTIQINVYVSQSFIPEELFIKELELPLKQKNQTQSLSTPDIKVESASFEVFAENESMLIYGVKEEINELNTTWNNKDSLNISNEYHEDYHNYDDSDCSSASDTKQNKPKEKKKAAKVREKKRKRMKVGRGYRYHEFNGKIDIPDCDIIRYKADIDPTNWTTVDWENLYLDEKYLAKQLPYYKIMEMVNGDFLYFLKYNKTGNFYMANFDLRAITCDICGTKTKEIPQLIKHRNLHFFERNSELKCAACTQEFDNYDLLVRHALICKEKFKLSGDKCKYCGKRFGSYASLRAHVLIHVPHLLPESRQEKICEICSKVCPDQDRLRAHRRRSHKIDAYCCDHCQKKFAERPELQKHLIRKHFPHLAPLRCSYCDSPFTTECLLKIHVNTVHLNSLDVECQVCQKKMRPNSMKAHMNKHMKLEERKKVFMIFVFYFLQIRS